MTSKQLYKWAFTWNCKDGWDEKQFAEDHVRVTDAMKKYAKKWIFQLERGAQGRLHYQGYMSLVKKSIQGSLARCLQSELEAFHISPCNAVGEASLKTYCMKADTKVSGPWKDVEDVEKDKEMSKLLRQDCEFDLKEEYSDIETHPRAFQSQLRAMTDPNVTNRRQIIWVGDPKGNSGKTHWGNWMADVYGAEFHTYGKATDIVNVICKRPKSRLYIFNLPRAKPGDATLAEILNVMEQLKDGRVIGYKYEGSVLRMRKPHVIVFANYWPSPKQAADLASSDRWRWYEIDYSNWQLRSHQLQEHVTADHE